MMGLGSLVWSLPHFAVTPYNRSAVDGVADPGIVDSDLDLRPGRKNADHQKNTLALI